MASQETQDQIEAQIEVACNALAFLGNGQAVVDCDKIPTMPDVTFAIGGKNFSLTSDQYVLKVGASLCSGGVKLLQVLLTLGCCGAPMRWASTSHVTAKQPFQPCASAGNRWQQRLVLNMREAECVSSCVGLPAMFVHQTLQGNVRPKRR